MKTELQSHGKAGAPLTIEEVDLAGPREGEVLVEIKEDRNLPHRLLHPVGFRSGRYFSIYPWARKERAS